MSGVSVWEEDGVGVRIEGAAVVGDLWDAVGPAHLPTHRVGDPGHAGRDGGPLQFGGSGRRYQSGGAVSAFVDVDAQVAGHIFGAGAEASGSEAASIERQVRGHAEAQPVAGTGRQAVLLCFSL